MPADEKILMVVSNPECSNNKQASGWRCLVICTIIGLVICCTAAATVALVSYSRQRTSDSQLNDLRNKFDLLVQRVEELEKNGDISSIQSIDVYEQDQRTAVTENVNISR